MTDALGFYLAEDVFAADPLPPFPASIKDGYAVVGMCIIGLHMTMSNLHEVMYQIPDDICNPYNLKKDLIKEGFNLKSMDHT